MSWPMAGPLSMRSLSKSMRTTVVREAAPARLEYWPGPNLAGGSGLSPVKRKKAIFRGLPSSKSWKSALYNPVTGWP